MQLDVGSECTNIQPILVLGRLLRILGNLDHRLSEPKEESDHLEFTATFVNLPLVNVVTLDSPVAVGHNLGVERHDLLCGL